LIEYGAQYDFNTAILWIGDSFMILFMFFMAFAFMSDRLKKGLLGD